MASESVLTNEIKGMIGLVGEPYTIEVERGMIKRLARAVDDDNPLWQNREYAFSNGHTDVISPPYLLLTSLLTGSGRGLPKITNPALKKRLDGGGKWEFFQTIKPGDLLVAIGKFTDAYEKEGKNGKMLFLVTDVTVRNQFGDLVGKCQTTQIEF